MSEFAPETENRPDNGRREATGDNIMGRLWRKDSRVPGKWMAGKLSTGTDFTANRTRNVAHEISIHLHLLATKV
jgi:hypothetical protein